MSGIPKKGDFESEKFMMIKRRSSYIRQRLMATQFKDFDSVLEIELTDMIKELDHLRKVCKLNAKRS